MSRYHGASSPSPKRHASETSTSSGPGEPEREDARAARAAAPCGPAAARARRGAPAARRAARTGSSRRRAARRSRARAARRCGRRAAPAAVTSRRGTSRSPRDAASRRTRARRAAGSGEHVPVARGGDSGFGGRGGPSGQAPSSRKHVKTIPTNSQKSEPAAQRARAPARAPIRCRRQSAKRSTAATKNGTSSAISTSSIAQPRTIAVAEPDVARRPLRELEPLVERAEQSPAPTGPSCASLRVSRRPALSPNAGRRPAARARERDRGDPARDERPLLVEREREAEVDELRRRTPGCSGRLPRLLEDRAATRSATSVVAGERGRSPAISIRGGPRSGERVEVDARRRRGPRRRGSPREAERAEAAERAGVGREEDERVRRLDRRPASRTAAARRRARARAAPRSRSRCRSRPGPTPVSSRCAITTIASRRLARRRRPSRSGAARCRGPGIVSRHAVGARRQAVTARACRGTTSRRASAPGAARRRGPGTASRARARAASATLASNAGGSDGRLAAATGLRRP